MNATDIHLPSDPTLAELEAAIVLHAYKARRNGRTWREYEWTHEQINLLLDERDAILNRMAAEAAMRNGRQRALRFFGINPA